MGVTFKRGNYWLDYRYNYRRYRKKVGPYKALADNAWAKIKTEIAENRFLDVKRIKQVRFGEFAEEYFKLHCLVNHKSAERSAGGRLKTLKAYWGQRYLNEITPVEIEKYKGARMGEVSPATVNRELAVLKAMFNKAIKWDKFDSTNPVKDVPFLREGNQRLRYLEKEEIAKLVQSSRGIIRPLVIMAVNTGMRRGELFGLKWKDVDLSQNLIHLLETKSGKKREIPINDNVRGALISIRKHPQSPYVFTKSNGSHIRDVRRAFKSALKKAGIKGFRFHDLRHTFASQLVMAGVDLNTVRELLGHADLKTTLIYSHLSKDHKQRAVNILCSGTGESPVRTQPQASPEVVLEPASYN